MNKFNKSETYPIKIKPYALALTLIWSAIVAASLLWNVYQYRQEIHNVARIQARDSFRKDVVYRRWNAGHGGVYVPATDKTPSNPYLEVPERDITTPSGVVLTLMNPAYMTLQVHELSAKTYGIQGHITSLNPIRPANAPDPWEIRALEAFQYGAKEISSIEEAKDDTFMRLMRPLVTEQSCLKCHAEQGYKIGDIRGGISVSVPMSPLWAIEKSNLLALSLGHSLLWLVGLVGIGLGSRRLSEQITDRKKAEEALQFTQFAVDHSSDAAFWVGSDARFIYVNEAACHSLGYSKDEFLAMTVHDIDPDLPQEVWPDHWAEVKRRGSFIVESHHRTKEGRIFPVEITVNFLEFGGNEFNCVFARDITDRKQAEEALQESEEKYRNLVERANDGVIIIQNGIVKFSNTRLAEMLGYIVEEVINTPFLDYIFPDERSIISDIHKRRLQGEDVPDIYEMAALHKNGRKVDIETNTGLITYHGKPATLTFVRDITERKQAEKKLLDEKEFTETALNAQLDTFFLFESANGKAIRWNRAFNDITGYSDEEIAEMVAPDSYYSPEDLKQVSIFIQEVLETGTGTIELELICKDGRKVPTEYKVSVINDDEGKPKYFISIGRDISNRKRAEDELKMERDRAQMYLDVAGVIFVALDEEGKVVLLNREGCEILGYEEQEIVGKPWFDYCMPESMKNEVKSVFAQLMKGVVDPIEYYENPVLTKKGEERHIAWHNALLRNEKGDIIGTFSSGEDITDRKIAAAEREKLVAQLKQAQKMESIGTLAGGIAHDFNNILSPILLYTEMVLEDISEKSHLRFSLEEILRASLRAKDLTKQILTFSRQAEQERIPLMIYTVIKEALRLLRASLPSTIEIRQNIEVKDSVVLADPTQIHQILMNLCTNAANAMRERGGVLEVILVDADLHSYDTDNPADLEPGQYIKLTVSDTGHGIEPAIMDKIFDPYFTTQENGKGTGLGLSVVHGIVNTHGGHISVHSEPDKGTRFDVYLPLFDLADIKAETVSTEKLTIGNEHILLVDDEKPIVDVVQQMLERLGYQVTVRTSSIEALEVFRASMDKFDLVITDLTMPNMTGDKLAGELMNIRPDISIILCTGFSEKMSKEKAEALGIKAFIMKPIVTSELAKLIREVLDKS